jgi:type I restriction-modification system DNA methylase subunit
MKIKDETLKILAECSIKDNTVFLPKTQLDRKTYLDVNKHLENLGGKWNRKAKGHVFDDDPTDSFENMLLTGETTDFKKEFQFFETPPELASKMIRLAEIKEYNVVLEPSAGHGAILDCLLDYALKTETYIDTIIVEFNPSSCDILGQKGYAVLLSDFLEIDVFDKEIDRVIANPPFTRQQDIDHILHAYSLLKPGGAGYLFLL